MELIKIDKNFTTPIMYDTLNFYDFCGQPVKSILILRSEIALFQGVNNHSDRYIRVITDGINSDIEVIHSLLEKTIGGSEKVKSLFINFNKVYEQTSKELKYFGPLLLSDNSMESLTTYLESPGDANVEVQFLSSLGDMLVESEERIKSEIKTINRYVAAAISDI